MAQSGAVNGFGNTEPTRRLLRLKRMQRSHCLRGRSGTSVTKQSGTLLTNDRRRAARVADACALDVLLPVLAEEVPKPSRVNDPDGSGGSDVQKIPIRRLSTRPVPAAPPLPVTRVCSASTTRSTSAHTPKLGRRSPRRSCRENPHGTSRATSSSVKYPRASANGSALRRSRSNLIRLSCCRRASRKSSLRVRPVCLQSRSRSFSRFESNRMVTADLMSCKVLRMATRENRPSNYVTSEEVREEVRTTDDHRGARAMAALKRRPSSPGELAASEATSVCEARLGGEDARQRASPDRARPPSAGVARRHRAC